MQDKSVQSTSREESLLKCYLQLRTTILQSRYGVPKDVLFSSRSRTVSLRSASIASNENKNLMGNSQDERYMSIRHMFDHVSIDPLVAKIRHDIGS